MRDHRGAGYGQRFGVFELLAEPPRLREQLIRGTLAATRQLAPPYSSSSESTVSLTLMDAWPSVSSSESTVSLTLMDAWPSVSSESTVSLTLDVIVWPATSSLWTALPSWIAFMM